MNEQQLPQISELANGNIGTSSGLETFHATNTNTDVSSLDHRHVICTIPDG
jgi:hypothetical protein